MAIYVPMTDLTSSATLDTSTGGYFVDASAGNVTLTLLDLNSAWNGTYWIIKRVDTASNTVTISAPSGTSIDGSSSLTLLVNNSSVPNNSSVVLMIHNDGTTCNYRRIFGY